MAVLHTESVVSSDGSLVIKRLLNFAGHKVEVIIKDKSILNKKDDKYPLKDSVKKYDQPFEGIANNDWEILK